LIEVTSEDECHLDLWQQNETAPEILHESLPMENLFGFCELMKTDPNDQYFANWLRMITANDVFRIQNLFGFCELMKTDPSDQYFANWSDVCQALVFATFQDFY
jgi:hypothetical protein